jgi:site-specific DNA recombinase
MSRAARPAESPNDDRAPARALIYLRVSTKEQAEAGGEAEGYSIPAQREACRRKAEALGAVVVHEFADRGESARTSARPELQRMLAYVAENPVAYVIVHKVDRLARNRSDDVQIHMALKRAGVTLVSCSENIDETPSGMLLHGIMSSIAEFYSRNLANEVIKGSVQKAKGGGTIGKAPTGYLNVRRVENGREIRTIEIDTVRAPLMRFAFEAYATGEWTLRALLAEVTRRGLDTTPGPKTPSRPLVLSHFHRLLKHPYYKGVVRYRGVEYPGKHEPLVSEATWDRVQELLDQKGRSGEKQRQHHHYLKGSVFCGTCGSRLIVSHAKNRHGRIYPYFLCIGRQQKRTTCTQSAIRIEEVEQLVEDHYLTIQPTDELLAELRELILDEIATQRTDAEGERDRQQRRIRSLLDERKKLLDAHYADAVPLDLLKIEQDRISQGIAAAEERLRAIDIAFDTVEANLNQAIDFAADWRRAYLTAGTTLRRQLNQAIFKKIWIDDTGNIHSELADPFELLLSDEVAIPAKLHAAGNAGATEDEIDALWRALSDKWAAEAAELPVLAAVGAGSDKPRHGKPSRGLKFETLVGREGLEPPAFCASCRCSSQLS